jgi:hypothetical protein
MEALGEFGVGPLHGLQSQPYFSESGYGKPYRYVGYWKFDDISIDCEGELVSLDPNDKCPSERDRLFAK